MRAHLTLLLGNGVAQIIGTLFALVFTLLATRTLSVSDYGELRYVLTLLPLIMVLSLPGYDSLILRQASAKRPIPLHHIFSFRCLASLTGSLLILGAVHLAGSAISDTLRYFLIVAACFLPLFETASGYRNFLLGRGLAKQGTRLLLRARVVSFSLFLILSLLIYLNRADPLLIFPAWLMATVTGGLSSHIALVLCRRNGRLVWRRQHGSLTPTAALSVTLAGLAYTAAYSLDKLWIRHELGPESLALYSLLIMIPQEIAKIGDTSVHLYYRRLFFSPIPHARWLPYALLGLMIVLMLGFVIGFSWLSPYVFGTAYSYSWPQVALAALLMPGLWLESFASHTVLARRGPSGLLQYNLLSLALTIVAVWLGMQNGINGLLLALFFKQCCLAFGVYLTHRRAL